MYPIESVLSCLEIKSVLSSQEMRDAYNKFQSVEEHLKFSPGIHDEHDNPLPHRFSKPEYSIFAFNIDKKKYKLTSILEMYKKIDPSWDQNPLVSSFCVAGKGCLVFNNQKWIHMEYDERNHMHEEIIFYLCATIQTLPIKEESRSLPRVGYYLTNPLTTDHIKNGVVVKKPWQDFRLIISNTNVD